MNGTKVQLGGDYEEEEDDYDYDDEEEDDEEDEEEGDDDGNIFCFGYLFFICTLYFMIFLHTIILNSLSREANFHVFSTILPNLII